MNINAEALNIVKKKPYIIRINGIKKKSIRRGYILRVKSKSIKKCYFLSFYTPSEEVINTGKALLKEMGESNHTSENNHHES